MTTDNRTNEMIVAEALREGVHVAGGGRSHLAAADVTYALGKAGRLVAAQGAAPHRPVIDREKLIDVLVMTDLSDYAGTDMRAISQCADAILAHLAADTGGQRDA